MESVETHQPASAAVHASAKCCSLKALSVVGTIANIIRTVFAIGLAVAALLTVLRITGVFAVTTTGVLWAVVIIEIACIVLILFDASTAQWLVEKVLTRLSDDVDRFETDLAESSRQLKARDIQLETQQEQIDLVNEQIVKQQANTKMVQEQLEERETQLGTAQSQLKERADQLVTSKRQQESLDLQLITHKSLLAEQKIATSGLDDQLAEQKHIVVDQKKALVKTANVQKQMQILLESMMDAESEGIDLNALLSENLSKLDRLYDHASESIYEHMDTDGDGMIDLEEFKVYHAKGPGSRATRKK
jgi:hypothetical protein